MNTGPQTPGIKANIALSSTKVRTLPNLLSISTLLPYTPLLPPFFPPRGQNTLFFGNVGSRRGRGFYTRTPPGTVLRSCGQPAGLRHFSKTIPEGVLDVDGTHGRRSYHSQTHWETERSLIPLSLSSLPFLSMGPSSFRIKDSNQKRWFDISFHLTFPDMT